MKITMLILALISVASAKVTRRGTDKTLYSAELQIIETESPRKMESPIITSKEIHSCLREAILKSGDDFSVTFTGNLNEFGKITDINVTHPFDSLRDCLTKALPKVKFGGGAGGPFNIEISRVRTTPPPSKTFLLDLNDSRKFQ